MPRLLTVLLAFAFLTVACSSSDDESSTDGESGGSTVSADETPVESDGSESDSSDNGDTDDGDTTASGDDDAGESAADDEPLELFASDLGVTEDSIVVGVVFPDTSVIGRDPGDIEAKFQTVADAINAEGGVNGRMLDLRIRLVDPIDDSDSETACVELTEDIGVFAVIGTFVRTTADCYAGLNDTVVVSTFGITDEQKAGYTAPALSLPGSASRLIGARVEALFDAGVLSEGMAIAVVGGQQGAAQQEQYVEALEAAGVDVVADTVILGDANDSVALTDELITYTEVWKSSGAEAVLGSAGLVAQSFVIAYNNADIDLPILLPQGLSVAPSFIQSQLGVDLDPFELATALVEGDDTATKYETGADGVRECVDAFEAASGEEVALDESRNNLGITIIACQVFDIFVPIAEAAGADLTTESFLAAAEAFGPIEVTNVSEASVGPGKLDLADVVGVLAEYDPETLQFVPVG
ncbi:MAG: ABC transporter substrate-binding protein [Actinomycetota bacterium]